MVKREKLEEKYPELAGDRRPVLAHEGAFEAAPVRAGDAPATQMPKETFGSKSGNKEVHEALAATGPLTHLDPGCI